MYLHWPSLDAVLSISQRITLTKLMLLLLLLLFLILSEQYKYIHHEY